MDFNKFEMGPDFEQGLGSNPHPDLRRCRPYFLVPLLKPQGQLTIAPEKTPETAMDPASSAFWRIVGHIKEEQKQGRFTDVFIVSHGWHRNFYGAVSAYDRLVSRLLLLWRTNRLRTEDQEDKGTPPQYFKPLFLTLHWHSDPGENGWVDKCGRRHKASFLQNVAEVFEEQPKDEQDAAITGQSRMPEFTKIKERLRTNDFEEIYELMAQLSSPSQDALTDTQIDQRVKPLTERLFDYRLKNAADASNPDKVAVAWKCYHEAQAKGVLLAQDLEANRVLSFRQAGITLVKFAVSALGIAFVIGKVLNPKAFSSVTARLTEYVLTPLAVYSDGRTLLEGARVPDILNKNKFLAFILLAALAVIMRFGVAVWHKKWQQFSRAEKNVSPDAHSERMEQLTKLRRHGVQLQRLLLLVGVCSAFVYVSGGYYSLLAPVRDAAHLAVQFCRSAWHYIPLPGQHNILDRLWESIRGSGWLPTRHGTALYLYAATISIVYLLFSGLQRQMPKRQLSANGLPILLVLTWLLLELPLLLPIVAFLLVSYLFGGTFVNLAVWASKRIKMKRRDTGNRRPSPGFLFDERLGRRNVSPGEKREIPWQARTRLWLGKLVRWPIFYLQQAIAEDSSVAILLDTLDSQLAFYEMQYRGVQVGAQTADFVAQLYEKCKDELQPSDPALRPRLHLLGHSFGALVVANAARHLVLTPPAAPRSPLKIDSLCLLQGALASDWFEGEQKIRDSIDMLACVYSGYDTANGFLYPAVNRARMAAGSAGMFLPDSLYREGVPIIQSPCYASLVRPPDESSLLSGKPISAPYALNVDASRLIYAGAIATGGGHDDIFKDDVVHLLWGILRLTWLPRPQR